jgi:hypothetical protein
MRGPVPVVLAGALVAALAGCVDEEPGLPQQEGSVFALQVGTCFDEPTPVDGRIVEVPLVDCAQAHDHEVHALVTLEDGVFPGSLEIVRHADEACVEHFEDYVGVDYADSTYLVSYLAPSERSWELGDRTITCFLYDEQGPSIGSAAGTGR